MLQDISFGTLDNQYRYTLPQDGDAVVCVKGGGILFCRREDGTLALPTAADVGGWSGEWHAWGDEPLRYAFTMQERRFFLWMGSAEVPCEPWEFLSANTVREPASKDICFAAMTAWHLYCWYRDSRFCGRCAASTQGGTTHATGCLRGSSKSGKRPRRRWPARSWKRSA